MDQRQTTRFMKVVAVLGLIGIVASLYVYFATPIKYLSLFFTTGFLTFYGPATLALWRFSREKKRGEEGGR